MLHWLAGYRRGTAEALGLLDGRSFSDLEDVELTDATDDFDFVTVDEEESPLRTLIFRALDNERRTDTWLSNRAELERGTLPWDPDTDDDGLTDGQEAKWVTDVFVNNYITVNKDETIPTDGLSPTTADSDGDGYWDGWIGVYGVGRTENVVLYREHLRDNGVQGDETVPEQAGVHRKDAAPSAMGATIQQNDNTRYHSNIHIGELQWGTDPSEGSETPTPTLSVEVDYYAGAAYEELDSRSWAMGIERNYALYGIDVNVVRDETLSDEDFTPCAGTLKPPSCVSTESFGPFELIGTRLNHQSTTADEYVLVTNQAGAPIPNPETQTGFNSPIGPTQGIFVVGHTGAANSVPSKIVQNSSYDSALALVAAKTEIHEIGHSFGIGEADDRTALEDPVRKITRNGEVYSGSGADRTPEELHDITTWSIMRSGWNERLYIGPMAGRYFAFSIEELSTIKNE